MTIATSSTIEPPADIETCIRECNSLLRGELSAIETYQQAIDKFGDEPEGATLRSIQAEHKKSAHELREHILQMAAAPETDSGSWGTLTQAVQSAANFFGEDSAVRSLTQGEKIGETSYQSALQDDGLMNEAKLLIRDRLLPRVTKHIETLEKLQEKL